MSIKKVGPQKFVLRVQWRDPKTGRKRSAEETFLGGERAAKSRHAELAQEAKQRGERKERQRLVDYATSWLTSRASRLKPSVSVRYAAALEGHILPALGDYFLDMLDRNDIQQYVAHRTRAGAAGNTVMNELRLLRAMAREASADGLCGNWADRVEPPRVNRWSEDRPNLLSAEQLAAVLKAVPRRWLAMVTLAAFTGLRWGELSALRWGDIDEEKGAIRVRRANWRGRIVEVKTAGSQRTVPLPPPVGAMLKAGRGKPEAYLFLDRAGGLYKAWPLVNVMRRACAAAGVPYVTPHGLRRTFNNLARQVAASQVVKSITGHTTDAMLEHYSMVSIGEKAEASKMVLRLVAASVPKAAATFGDERLPPRFWAKARVDAESGCWLFKPHPGSSGYARIRWNGPLVSAHRLAFEMLVGPIPEGLELDHVKARGCTSRACVNPAHLEPVTRQENIERSSLAEHRNAHNLSKTHCPRGHEYAGDNLRVRESGWRECRACHAEDERERRRRKREESTVDVELRLPTLDAAPSGTRKGVPNKEGYRCSVCRGLGHRAGKCPAKGAA